MRIFVTGGSGFVGGHFIEHAAAQGHEVVAMARSRASAGAVERFGATPVEASLDDVAATHLKGCDAVVHAAAFVADWGTRAEFEHGNVVGTQRMLDAARAAGVRRFVYVGTEAAIFDGRDLIDVDESFPYPARQQYLYSETKAEAERRVLAASAGAFETISIRPRLVWGPRDAAVLPTVLRMAAAGQFAWLSGGEKRTSSTYVRNLAHALLLATERGRPGEAYFVADDGTRTIRALLTSLAAAKGVRLPARSIPKPLARTAAYLVEGAYRLAGSRKAPPMTRFAIDMMSAEVTVDTRKATRELGYAPIVSFDAGLAELRADSLLPRAK